MVMDSVGGARARVSLAWAVAIGVSAAAAGTAVAQTDATFTGGGVDDLWTNPDNWDTADYPDAGNPAGAMYNVLIGSGSSVDLNGNIVVEDLTLGAGAFGLSVDRTGPVHTQMLTVNGLFTWSGGSLRGGNIDNVNFNSGVLDAQGGIAFNNASPVELSHWTVNNAGTATITGSNVNFSVAAVFNNESTGLVDFQSDADFVRFNTSASLTNAGTIRKSAGAGVSEIDIHINQTSTGIIDAQVGTLEIGAGSYAGALRANGGTLRMGFGNAAFQDTAFAVTGGGGVEVFADGDYSGTFTSTGDGTGLVEVTGDLNVGSGQTAILAFSADAPISFWSTTGDGTLINQGAAIWAANTIGGGLINQGDFEIGGTNAAHSLGANQTLTNETGGVVTHVANTSVNLLDGTAIDNQGVWDVRIDHSLLFDARSGTGQTLTNAGTLKKTAGAGTATIKDVAVSSTGVLLSTSGTLRIESAGHISGEVNADGGTVTLGGGDLVLDNVTFDVRNGGRVETFQFFGGGATTQLLGTFTSTGDGSGAVALGGPLNVAGGEEVTFDLSDQAPLQLLGELDGTGMARNVGSMQMLSSGGRILMGDGTAGGGAFYNHGPDAHLQISTGQIGVGGNAGTLINEGGNVLVTNALFIQDTSLMVNTTSGADQGVWTMQDSADIFSSSGVFDNQAIFRKTGPGDSTVSPTFINTGLVEVQGGRLIIANFTQNTGTLQLSSGTTLSANFGSMDINGGFVQGNGTLSGDVNHNGGFLEPGTDAQTGKLIITSGFYNQGEDAYLRIDIAGDTPETEHDVLEVGMISGYSANLAGTIQVLFDAGYTPTLGQTFDVLFAGGLINDLGFDLSVRGLARDLSLEHSIIDFTGVPFDTSDDHQFLRLTVVPEPATAALLAAAGLLPLRRRRRQATVAFSHR